MMRLLENYIVVQYDVTIFRFYFDYDCVSVTHFEKLVNAILEDVRCKFKTTFPLSIKKFISMLLSL